MPNATSPAGHGRAFILFGGFLAGTLAGGWLGLVAAFVSGLATSGPPRFPGEDLVAAILAGAVLAVLCILVRRAGGGLGPPARDRAESKGTRNDLLFSAAFAAFVVVLSVDSRGAIPLLALLPALVVALLFALAAVRRSLLLRLAGLSLGVLYVLAGLLLKLMGSL